jgi:hypothetical protein
MSDTPQFFLPKIDPEKQEQAYAEIARFAGARTAPDGERVYSIEFVHNGVEWTATVGERMTGIEHVRKKSRGKMAEFTRHHSDRATIMAIFPGHPYVVIHDAAAMVWTNPFMAGVPRRVTRFAANG